MTYIQSEPHKYKYEKQIKPTNEQTGIVSIIVTLSGATILQMSTQKLYFFSNIFVFSNIIACIYSIIWNKVK